METRKKITPATIRTFNGKRYYILTNIIPKYRAVSIANSYRKTGDNARIVKVTGGYVVYVSSKRR